MKFAKSLKLLTIILLVTSIDEGGMLSVGEVRAQNSPGTPASVSANGSGRAKNDIDSTVVYTARDSLVYYISRRSADLFGKAKVEYKDIRIEGPRITVEQATRTAHTSAIRDSSGKLTELPVFTDKSGSFRAESMEYNYETRIGKVAGFSSKEELGIFTGDEVTRLASGELLVENGIYTTCDLDEPHYWFAGKRMSIMPGERLTSRPFAMYIHPEIFNRRLPVIPVIWLPYLSVPISNKRSSGFLLPGVGQSGSRGVWLSNLGYFWAINDYADLRVESDFSFNGSWRIGERFRYKKRDVYSGSFEVEFARITLNERGDPDYARYENRNFSLTHHQMFDPASQLDINVQYIGGDRYYGTGSINPEWVIADQATSYASFAKAWDEGNRVLIAGYQRVDNLRTDAVTQSVTASLYQNRMYPFRSDSGLPDSDWRSRFSLQPSVSASGKFVDDSGSRSDLYTGNAGLDLNYQHDFASGYRAQFTQGITVQAQRQMADPADDLDATRLQLPFRVNTTLFRYLNLTPSLTYTRYRVNSTVRKSYDSVNHSVVTETVHQPADYETTVFSLDAQTRLYGVFNTGPLEKLTGLSAVRHTLIPTISLTCNPDYRGSGYDYYGSYINTDTNATVRYNRFEKSLYADVPEQQTTLGISLQNLFHGRFRSDGVANGSGYKTQQLLSLTASSGYNFAADSLRAQPLVVTASSNALSPRLLFSAGAIYDFYTCDPSTGDRTDKLVMDEGNGLLRFVNGFLNMSLSFSGTLRSTYTPSEENGEQKSLALQDASPVESALYKERFNSDDLVKFNGALPWSLRMSLYLTSDKSKPLDPSSTILVNSSGRLALSRNWQVGFNTGFDFSNGEFVYPALMVYRDLHDFQLSCQWVPSGEYRGYLLQIAMKPPHLSSLKVKASSGNASQIYE